MTEESGSNRRGDLFPVTLAELALLLFFLLGLLAAADRLESETKQKEQEEKMEKQLGIVASKEALEVIETLAREEPEDWVVLVQSAAANKETETKLVSKTVEVDRVSQENQDLRLRQEILQRQLAAAGRDGHGRPPCWPTSDGMSQEFIYTVTIHRDHFAVDRRWPEHRADDAEAIPGARALVRESLSIDEFRRLAAPVRKWSNEHKCVHFVWIDDKVGNSIGAKDAYKRNLRTVEDYFFKFEPR